MERRREPRWPSYYRGRISFANRFSTVDCIVRNGSAGGFRLAVHNGAFLPDEFDLAIPRKSIEMRVRSRWRSPEAMGVEVVRAAAVPEPPISLAMARRVRELEQANASLRRRLDERD